ncbi:MAG: hypothetical protein MI924_23530 [Chloroflexales bacterium]|nr:hypothetical protein [Chloroflexales bacterium]
MTATVTTTTATAIASGSILMMALMAVLALIALLIQQEIFSSINRKRAYWISHSLNIAIFPLMLILALTVVTRLIPFL